MKLLIDAGNTRIKWCWYDGEDLPLDYESAEYEDLEEQGAVLFEGPGPDTDDILICNVAGDDTEAQFNSIFDEWSIKPRYFLTQTSCCGVTNAYQQPDKLGVDRWMALIGAWTNHQQAACIVDCGTAVTIDVINENGQHLGGMIVPGMELMQESLVDQTSGIFVEEATEMPAHTTLLAQDTVSAIAAGSLYALVALIERVRQDIEKELDVDLPLYISGGDADLIEPLLGCESNYEPMLIFQGMLAADENATD